MRAFYLILLISICFGLYFLLPSVFKDDESGHRASIAAQHNPKLSNVDGLVNLITSAPDLNEGKILKIEAEPGSFYLTVIDSSGTTQLLRTASISQGTLFGKLDINQNVRWRALAEDTNYFSKHLNKHFDRILLVVLEPKLPKNGLVKNVNILDGETEILVKVEDANISELFVLLKLKDTKKETSVKVSEGDMISWDEARLVSTRSTPIRTAVLAIDAFTINPNN